MSVDVNPGGKNNTNRRITRWARLEEHMYRILTDEDIDRTLEIETVLNVIEQTLRAKAEGALIAPPRFSLEVNAGALVFTAGTETKYSSSIGFRVYDTFSDQSVDHQQLVAVFDSQTGNFRGLVIGKLVGALRTAAINAIAIQHMARSDAKNLGILGSGFQAGYHTQAAMVARQFQRAKIYSPNISHREVFAAEMSARTGIPIEAAGSAEEVVRFAEVLICATKSTSPMLDASWVAPGTHVNTIGPKFKGMAEIPYELAQKSRVIATDSLQQADSYPKPFFLLETPERERMLDLSEIVVGKQQGRLSSNDVTLFCSVGLAGTEVVLADEALRRERQS
jgi:ornithine cyclodeaminase/alanine dehydrogenase-like protein (mu-crystallin family)